MNTSPRHRSAARPQPSTANPQLVWLLALALLVLVGSAHAATNTWTGAGGDGLWSNRTNWSAFAVPGASDDVVIPAPNDATIYYYGQQPKVRNLDNSKTLVVYAYNSTGNATLQVAAGVTNQGRLVLQGAGDSYNCTVTLTNDPGAVLVNVATGTLEVRQGNGYFYGSVVNWGVITNAAEAYCNATLENRGSVLVGAGNWYQSADFNQEAGLLSAPSGSFWQRSGRLSFDGGATAGSVFLQGGELAVAATVTTPSEVYAMANSRLVAMESPAVTVSAYSWNTKGNATLRVAAGVTNRGRLVLEGWGDLNNSTSTLTNENNGTLVNAPGAVIEVRQGNGYFYGSVVNSGVITNAAEAYCNAALENRGSVLVGPGNWYQSADFNQEAGLLSAPSGSFWQRSGRLSFDGGATAGSVFLQGGELAVAATVTTPSEVYAAASSRLVAMESSAVTVSAYSWNTKGNATLRVAAGVTNRGRLVLQGAGDLNNSTSTLTNENNGTLVNAPGAVIEVRQGNGYFYGSVVNWGVITNAAEAYCNAALENRGTVLVGPGNWYQWADFNQEAGLLSAPSGSFWQRSGRLSFDGGATAGSVFLQGGELAVAATVTTPSEVYAAASSRLVAMESSAVTVSAYSWNTKGNATLRVAAGVTNRGRLVLEGWGDLNNSTSTLTNENNGTLVNAPGASIEVIHGTGYLFGNLVNWGTITNAAEAYCNATVENHASVLVGAGNWYQWADFAQEAGLLSGLNSVFWQRSGRLNFNGGAAVQNVFVQGGELAVAATVTTPSKIYVASSGRLVAMESSAVTVSAYSWNVKGNATLRVAAGVTNRGQLMLEGWGDGNSSTSTLTNENNGTLVNGPTGVIQPLAGSGGSRSILGSLQNYGTLLCDYPISIGVSGAQHQNYGVIRANSGTASFWGSSFTNQPGGVLTGTATLDFSGLAFLNNGSVSPGASPGTLSFTGNYVQGPLGRLDIEIVSGGYDRLAVSGTAALDGTLGVTYPGDFLPPVGSSNRVLTCSALSGGFAAATGLTYYTNAALAVFYRANAVDLVAQSVTNPVIEAPQIVAQPQSLAVGTGDAASFSVTASGTRPLGYQWQFNGANILSATNSAFSLQPLALSDSGGYRVIVSNAGGAVTSLVATLTVTNPLCAPPPAGLAAWWKAEGNANDLIGGNHGTLMNGAGFAPGRVGMAFSFDGVDDYISIPDAPNLNPSNQISVEAWYKGPSYQGGGTDPIVTKPFTSHTPPYYQYILGVTGDQYNPPPGPAACFDFGLSIGGQAVGIYTPSYFWTPGNWYHLVGTYDGQAVRLYINGALVVSQPATGMIDNFGQPIGIAKRFDGHHTPGLIDEVSIYSRALTSSEIAGIYVAGSAGKCVGVYQPGFAWKRSADWTVRADSDHNTTNGNPDDDAFGNPVWRYEYVTSGGPLGSAQPWFSMPSILMVWDKSWYGGAGVWAVGDDTSPLVEQSTLVHNLCCTGLPVVRWVNPSGGRLSVTVSGTLAVTWSGTGGVGKPDDVDVVVGLESQLGNIRSVLYTNTVSKPTPVPSVGDQVVLPVLLTPVTVEAGDRILVSFRTRSQPAGGYWNYLTDDLAIAVLSGSAAPPVITQQPNSNGVLVGDVAVFGVVATSAVPPSYQWRFNGAPLASGTNSTLSLTDVQTAQAGNYDVVIANFSGSVTSAVAVLTVITNIPDLRPSLLTSAPTALGGQLLSVSWVTTNAGNGIASAPWQESLSLADNPVGTNSTPLVTLAAGTSLAAGGSVVRTPSVILPGGLSGAYWLVVRVDSANQVAEGYWETNNVAMVPVVIASPDLSVSLLTSAPTAVFGQPFVVSWVVTNTGTGSASGSWSDRVWLSSASNSLAGATSLAVIPNKSSLESSASYTNGVTVTIPLNAQSQPGGYWLVAQADANSALPEMNEGNNLLSVPLALTLPPLPDIIAGAVSAPSSAVPGQTVTLTWAVSNLGPASLSGVWQESVHLLSDAGLDPTNAQSRLTSAATVATLEVTNTLAAGDSVVRTQAVTVPVDSPVGDTRFVVVVDSANQVVEANETNNVALAANVTTISAVLTLQSPVSQLLEGAPSVKATLVRNGSTSQALVVTVINSDPTEVSFSLSATTSVAKVTIPIGSSSAQFDVRALADGIVDGPQTVTISASATNFPTATATLTVLDADVPHLWLSFNPPVLVEGGSVSGTATRELVTTNALMVSLAGAGSPRLQVPASVTIPAGATSAVFTVSAAENFVVEGPRACTVFAQAPGYQTANAALTLFDNDLPAVTVAFSRTNVSEGDGAQASRVTVSRSPVTTEPVFVELGNSNTNALWVPQFVSVPAGQADWSFWAAAINNDITNAPQVAVVTPYILDAITGARLWTNPPVAITVNDDDGPSLRLTIQRKVTAEGGMNTGTIWRNTGTNGALVVNLSSSVPTHGSVPATVAIPDGQTTASFAIQALDDGVPDGNHSVTITASALGYTSSSDFFVVSDMDLPDFTVTLTSVPASADTESYVQIGYRVENDGVAAAGSNWVVKLFLARNPAAGYDVLLDAYTFPGTLPATPPLNFFDRQVSVRMPRETGNWFVVAEVDADNVVPELLEDNNTAVSTQPIQVLPAYTAIVTVLTNTLVAGTPVSLSGHAVMRGGTRPAGNVLVNLHIMRGDTNGLRRVISALTGADGSFATTLLPLPGEAGLYVVGAAHPGEASAPAQDSFRWLAMQAQPASVSLRLTEGGSAGGVITLQNLSGVPLTGLNVAVINASANLSLTPSLPGATLPASGSLALGYGLTVLNASVRQANATLHVTCSEGVTADVVFYVAVDPLVPNLVATPTAIVRSVLRGQQAIVEFDVVNNGGTNSGPITLSLPPLPWLSLVSTNPLPSLPPNGAGTNRVTLLLTPPADAPLSEFTGNLALNCANGGAGLAAPYRFRAVSDSRAPLVVYAEDEYTFYAAGSPRIAGASVAVADALSGTTLTNGVTDTNGLFNTGLLAEGYYTVTVTATNHSDDRETVLVSAGQTNEVHAFLSRQAVRYVWTVVPTEIEDRTRITIETVFETKVPMPVITVIPALIDLADFTQTVTQIDMTVTNAGLVAGLDATLTFDDHPLWQVTPLITNLGTIAASSSLTIPVEIRKKAVTGADCHVPCTFFGRAAWTLVSEGRNFGYNAPITFINAWTNCVCPSAPPTPPSIPPGGGGGWYGGGGGGGGVVPVNNPPPTFTPPPRCVPHLDGVCAKVKLQLNQDAVLTRDAFKATLEIENQTAGALSNVLVTLKIHDASGVLVPTNLFGIYAPVLSALSGVDGTGVVGAQTTGKSEWIIVPSVDAAPETNLLYTVGGTLTYLDSGAAVTVPLAATPITVHPLPQLKLDYFHQRDVFADDPWTPLVEPSIPYDLAVMVQNTGRGTAKQMRIVSAQPKIIENESGLLIDFKIIATEVAGQNMVPTLTAEFGDIAPGQIKVGRWLLTSTLQGQFTDYQASFQHLDDLGNPRLLIITNVAIHEMIHLVQAPGAFEDGKPDFLVNEIDDPPLDLPDTLYLSDGSKAPVTAVHTGSVTGTLGPGVNSVVLTAPMPAGWAYLRLPDPGNGAYELTKVVRSDNVQIYFNTNVWTTDRTFGYPWDRPTRENILHLLDYNSTGNYTLFYATPSAPDTNAPTSAVAALLVDNYQRFAVSWGGADNSSGSGLAFFDIYVSDNGGPFAPWLTRTTLRSATYPGTLGHSYSFYSRATDAAGNTEAAPTAPQATTLVSKTNSAPVFGPLPLQIIDEGQTLVFDLPVTYPNGDGLTFGFLTSQPTGMILNPSTGRLTWPTGEANGPSTNMIAVLATDNGFPPLSATGLVTVIVNEINQAPILAAITNCTIDEGFLLVITNVAFDADIPANKLTFSLGAGAPRGASINTTNGVFSWRPDSTQGPSTNAISVSVTDDGVPPLSATQQFTVIVRDVLPDFTVGIGHTNLMVGESSFVPVTLASTLDLVSLAFRLTADAGRITNMALQSVAPEVTSAALQSLGSNGYAVSFTLNPALQGDASRTLARLTFTAAPTEHSALLPLGLSDMTASRQSGIPVMQIGAIGGGVIVVGREPVLVMTSGPLLTLYGHPGALYEIDGRLTLGSGGNWTNLTTLVLAGRSADVPQLLPSAPKAFFRAVELEPSRPWLELWPSLPSLTLRLHGTPGTSYDLLRATNLLGPWLPSGSVSFTNSLLMSPWTNQGEPAQFFRLERH